MSIHLLLNSLIDGENIVLLACVRFYLIPANIKILVHVTTTDRLKLIAENHGLIIDMHLRLLVIALVLSTGD